ncbi:MAG: hypothetical protein M3416_13820 [Acidobacteriota bacterium]|nr:hypothetical protein [Acidobacteriota bacterium]
MRKYFPITFLTLLMLLMGSIAARSLRSSLGQNNQQGNSKPKHEDPRWPLVEYDSPEPADPREKAKRKAKNSPPGDTGYVFKPSPVTENGLINLVNDWEVGFPAIPTERSTIILIGKIQSARAYLSEDKTNIYSEFGVNVERIIKSQAARPLNAGDVISVERMGGRIRTPSGHIHQYGIHKQGMPKVGGRYVLFLGGGENEGFNILTGYELRGGKVFPLDGVDPADGDKLPDFAAHEGEDESMFLRTVENLLVQPSQQP